MPLPTANDHAHRPIASGWERHLILISTGIKIFLTDGNMNLIRIAPFHYFAARSPLQLWERLFDGLLCLTRRQGTVKNMRTFFQHRIPHL